MSDDDERAQQLRRARTPFVHATVVRAQQPSSAHPGDRGNPVVRRDDRRVCRRSVRAELRAQGGTRRTAGRRERAAAGSPRRRCALPGSPGRVRHGESVPVRWCAGDLPGARRYPRRWCGSTAPRRSPTRWPTCADCSVSTWRAPIPRPQCAGRCDGGGDRQSRRPGSGDDPRGAGRRRRVHRVGGQPGSGCLDSGRVGPHRGRARPGAHPGRTGDRRQDVGRDRGVDRRRSHPGDSNRRSDGMTAHRVTGVMLAAGRSSRLGAPKQLLPFRDTTVLGASLNLARSCPFDQIIVTLGGAAAAVSRAVPLDGVDVVVVDDPARDVRRRCGPRCRGWTRWRPESCCCSAINPGCPRSPSSG